MRRLPESAGLGPLRRQARELLAVSRRRRATVRRALPGPAVLPRSLGRLEQVMAGLAA